MPHTPNTLHGSNKYIRVEYLLKLHGVFRTLGLKHALRQGTVLRINL
jgi:hypothetical protein